MIINGTQPKRTPDGPCRNTTWHVTGGSSSPEERAPGGEVGERILDGAEEHSMAGVGTGSSSRRHHVTVRRRAARGERVD
eukprot:3354411-Rhodomonas_salina.2